MTDGHIFLSYRSIEADFALKLAADLKNAGVNLWMDRLDVGIHVGDDWVQSLQDAIDNCAAVIAVLSPDYVESKYCRRELKRADTLTRPIFPVLLRKLETTQWPFEIQEKQYIDFCNWGDENDYRHQFTDLFQALQERFPTQFGNAPDAETRYLTSLIAELESRKGVLEYVELSTHTDVPEDAPARPDPYQFDEWAAGFSMLIPQKPDATESQHVVYAPDAPKKITLSSIAEAVEKHSRFVLIGEPGAGKTTTIRKLARDTARGRLENPRTTPLPLFLYLPQWDDEPTPLDFVRKHWPFDTDPSVLVKQGDVLLYLDGLNEMGGSGSAKAEKLRKWFAEPDSPARVIVTCRAGDYEDDLKLGELPTVLAEELSEFQVRELSINYLHEKSDAFLARILPEDESQREDNRSLLRLARNPYLLAALIFVYANASDGDLPHNNSALMRALAHALWERERQKQTPGWIPFNEMEKTFAELAFAMIDEDKPIDVPIKYALRHFKDEILLRGGRSASLVELRNDDVRFYHQLMQEYFAAVKFTDQITQRIKSPAFDLEERITGKWDTVTISACGLSSDPDAALKTLIDLNPYLAADCIKSGIVVLDSTRRRLINTLVGQLRKWNKQFTEMDSFTALVSFWYGVEDLAEPSEVIRTLEQLKAVDVSEDLEKIVYWKPVVLRVLAINALGKLQIHNSIPLLEQLLESDTRYKDMYITYYDRDYAAELDVNLSAAIAYYREILNDSILISLAYLGKISNVKRLLMLASNAKKEISASIIESIAKHEIVISELISCLYSNDQPKWHDSMPISDLAAQTLERIGTPEALEAVERWRREQNKT